MFEHSDPVGRSFLNNDAVRLEYRRILQNFYDRFASVPNSAFTWLEAFDELSAGVDPVEQTIDWRAFPLLADATDSEIDANRFRWQDEYVEWRVENDRITFTTEFPEYFEAFAAVGFEQLVAAVQDVMPGSDPTAQELFGVTSPETLSPTARAQLFRANLRQNPWNNGQKGIICLTQRFNTVNALFNLIARCSVQSSGTVEDTCGLVGGACGEGRSSDPRVCSESQAARRANFGITLKNPAGIRIIELRDVWKINGQVIDIKDPAHGAWTVTRNGRRAVLKLVPGLTLGDDPIVTGAQVSRQLAVGADILAAPDAALPEWAKTGNEGQRGPIA